MSYFSVLKVGFQPDAEATDNSSSSSELATAEMTQSSSKSCIKSRTSKTSVKSKSGSQTSLKKDVTTSTEVCLIAKFDVLCHNYYCYYFLP